MNDVQRAMQELRAESPTMMLLRSSEVFDKTRATEEAFANGFFTGIQWAMAKANLAVGK